MNALARYQETSGKMVSLEKTEASFGQNVPECIIEIIPNIMGVKTIQSHSKYLGLPVLLGRSKKEVWKKLKGWKEVEGSERKCYVSGL